MLYFERLHGIQHDLPHQKELEGKKNNAANNVFFLLAMTHNENVNASSVSSIQNWNTNLLKVYSLD